MARTLLAAGIAGLVALTTPLPALGQDAAEPALMDEIDAGPADDFDDPLLIDNEFEATLEDELFATDEFNDAEAADTSDDIVSVETGSDGIPDAFELYDEDGETDYDDEEFAETDDQIDADLGHYFEQLPLIRKPAVDAAEPVAVIVPAAQPPAAISLARLSPPRSALGLLAGKWLGRQFPGEDAGAGLTHIRWPAVSPAAANFTSPALRLVTGISGAFTPAQGASRVLLVVDGGAPYQAQIKQAKSPRPRFGPAQVSKYANVPDWELQHVCGGTLIEPDWVLTAAHCLWPTRDSRAEPLLADGLNVLLGAENISRPATGKTYRADRLVIHRGWKPGNSGNMYRHDIALVHLVTGGAAPRVNQISSIDRYVGAMPGDRTRVSVTGWGKTRELESQLAATALWRADVGLIANTRCSEKPGFEPFESGSGGAPIARVHPGSLCAGESVGKACTGDSGGPLVLTNVLPGRLVGITSWTKERSCGKPEIPNVYTRVNAYEKWIVEAMQVPASAGDVTYF